MGKFLAMALLSLCLTRGVAGTDDDPPAAGMVDFLMEYLAIKYEGVQFDEFIYVAAKRQRLYHIRNGEIVKRYRISTSKYGVGSLQDSEKTPLGLHSIHQKYGDKVPIGGIFRERRYVGREAEILNDTIDVDADDVTTRIMWLRGEEAGINRGDNVDSRHRCIYIHGTPEEGLIGRPASHGCIRMRNTEVIELFEQVSPGTYVIILNN